uniref:Coiled-coil domain containing 9 n=1 Tax=Naja naja TaxID=35670 RepID=A0A8C6YFC2_NAJNA
MSAELELRSREEKDAELDKRIEALRRKNQALIRRYQEIEEDRRKAEREGVAVTGARKARSAEAAGHTERRRVETEASRLAGRVPPMPEAAAARGGRGEPQPGGRPTRAEAGWAGPGADGEGAGGDVRGAGSGSGALAGLFLPPPQEWEERRRRNIEQMNEEMEKIAEYERGQRDGLQEKNPIRNFLDDPRRSGAFSEAGRQEGSRRHVRNWGGANFDKVKTGLEPDKQSGRRRGLKTTLDMTLSMTGRERAEYTRWKQEREQIDRDRLARHRQPTGEWRREWDAEKTDPAMHDNRWEKEEADWTLHASVGEDKVEAASVLQVGPRQPVFLSVPQPIWETQVGLWAALPWAGVRGLFPSQLRSTIESKMTEEPQITAVTEEDEEEDEWEDVSGEEEEEEEEEPEANSSQDSSSEEDGLHPSCSPLPPRKPRQQLTLRSASPREAAATEGPPVTPLGPAEGYEPVSDWGEEMEMRSPRASSNSQSLLAALREEPPAGTSGKGQSVLKVEGS